MRIEAFVAFASVDIRSKAIDGASLGPITEGKLHSHVFSDRDGLWQLNVPSRLMARISLQSMSFPFASTQVSWFSAVWSAWPKWR